MLPFLLLQEHASQKQLKEEKYLQLSVSHGSVKVEKARQMENVGL